MPHWTETKQKTKSRQLASIPAGWRLDSSIVAEYQANIEKSTNKKTNAMEFMKITSLLSPQERAITESPSALHLLEKMRSGSISSEVVTRAFCHRAAIAHQLTNCLTEMWFEEAIAYAKKLDEEEAQGKLRGKFHGLPISLKDQHKVSGQIASIGYFAWATNPVEEGDESDMVVHLRNLGAVFYCKTNVPQSLMAWDSNNPLFDRVVNPFNSNLIPGGSSGGEGALIALRGSILGIGSDIGGSIRVPANFCGIAGFKPTTKRLPGNNCVATGKGQILVGATLGPMGHSVDDLETLYQCVLELEPWEMDPITTVPVVFRQVQLKKKMKIGYYDSLDCLKAQPPVRRAVQMVVDELKRAGHEVVAYTPPEPIEALHLLFQAFTQDGGADIKSVLSQTGEPYTPAIADTFRVAGIPKAARSILARALRLVTGDDLIPGIFNVLGPFTGPEIDQLNNKVDDYRRRFYQDWKEREFDFVLCPVNPCVAPPHDAISEVVQAFLYTGIWNLVDYPAGVLPVTFVGDEAPYGTETMVNAVDKAIRKWWEQNVDEYKGVPVGVQIVTSRWKDEECLAIMKEIETLMSK
jgi:amidase